MSNMGWSFASHSGLNMSNAFSGYPSYPLNDLKPHSELNTGNSFPGYPSYQQNDRNTSFGMGSHGPRFQKPPRVPVYNSQDPCGNCGNRGHHLKTCPYPNRHGFIPGCGHCNRTDHSRIDCRHRKIGRNTQDFHYLHLVRDGLCPAEDFRDFRQIPHPAYGYTLAEGVPLTPDFALPNPLRS